MAVEKGKVLAAIEAKLQGKSLTKNFKENLATKWAEKIETEDDIEAFVDDREDVLLEASSEADRRAVAAAKKAKSESQEPKQEETPSVDDDTPAWAKALIQKVEGFERQQKSQTIAERFRNDERIKSLKGLQEHMFKGRIPQSEEEYDAKVEEFVDDWKPYLEKTVIQDQKDIPPPNGKGAPKAGGKEISAEEAKAAVAAMGSFN